ncbi:UNVERIFIED_CONTAM: alkylresorcinol/alkylpyrone synthase [Brevibacillus sp. OAP136]
MPHIISVGTAVPIHEVSMEASMAVSRSLFADAFPDIDRLLSVFAHSNIRKRHFAAPLEWLTEDHPFAEKNKLFIDVACSLGMDAINRCLSRASLSVHDIDCLIFNTSTGLSTPSIDARLVNRLGLRQDVTRIPIWGLGCAGGATGLSRAFDYVRAYPDAVAVLVCVELCGLTFIKQDVSKSNLVATSLFGDGAGAVLVAGDAFAAKHGLQDTPRFLSRKTCTWYDSLDVMGWDVTDAGLKVIFSQDIPTLVKKRMRSNVDDFLSEQQLTRAQINHFILHPGGPKVINAYQQALEIGHEQTQHAEEILAEYGNMSSPTVLFVLEKSLQTPWRKQEIGLLGALGPGFSSELILLEQGGT